MSKAKRYDYVRELMTMMRGWMDVRLRERKYRRVLRKLVRDAVLRTVPSNEPTEGDREYANHIAKELVP